MAGINQEGFSLAEHFRLPVNQVWRWKVLHFSTHAVIMKKLSAGDARWRKKERTMRLKDDQITRLAERILIDLTEAELVRLKRERGRVLEGIARAIADDIRGEESLERDAELLLEKTLRSLGGGADIDRHKMLRMIKEKLARERKIVL
jgi:hypothetical protein